MAYKDVRGRRKGALSWLVGQKKCWRNDMACAVITIGVDQNHNQRCGLYSYAPHIARVCTLMAYIVMAGRRFKAPIKTFFLTPSPHPPSATAVVFYIVRIRCFIAAQCAAGDTSKYLTYRPSMLQTMVGPTAMGTNRCGTVHAALRHPITTSLQTDPR